MKDTRFSKTVPPLASLPRCTTCNKPHMPVLPTAAECFICALAARRKEVRK